MGDFFDHPFYVFTCWLVQRASDSTHEISPFKFYPQIPQIFADFSPGFPNLSNLRNLWMISDVV